MRAHSHIDFRTIVETPHQFVPSLRISPDVLSSQLSYVYWKRADFASAKTKRGEAGTCSCVQHIDWSIGIIAARLVAIRVWWFHTRIGEGSADVANRIQGH